MSFPRPTQMFQFRRFPTYAYLIQRTLLWYCHSGFPHSEISGSMLICSSPKLIAACHVLHRLLMPRHSPCALISLTYRNSILLDMIQFSSLELCRLIIKKFLAKLYFYPLIKNVSLLLPSHNLHHVVSMFSFQGTSELVCSRKTSSRSSFNKQGVLRSMCNPRLQM